MKTPRLLDANEIECRVGSINEKGLTLLLYKDARVDMALLDETYGADKWQRKHYELKDHIYCSVGIKLEDEWVWKDDVGTESVSEATKGESSDSFKRACFNWGIGRELYTAPFIWVAADKYNGFKNTKGKYATYDKFFVDSIEYDKEKREITGLTVINEKTGQQVFSKKKGKVESSSFMDTKRPKENEEPFETAPTATQLKEARKLLEEKKYLPEAIEARLAIVSTSEEANTLIDKLKASK